MCITAKNRDKVEVEDYSSDCPVRISYKAWFLSPPQNTVSGFPLKNKSAFEDSYDRICSYKRMRAAGVLWFYEANGNSSHNRDSLYFYYDPNGVSIAPSSLKKLDSLSVTKGHRIYLYSKENVEIDDSKVTICSSQPWSKDNEDESRSYGSGVIGLSYYDHVGSWVKAESDAIRDLLGKSAVSIASQRLNTLKEYQEVIRYEYDLEVENIRVERRWVNFDDWSCHVVVSAPTASISVWEADSTDALSNKAIELNKDSSTTPSEVVDSSPTTKPTTDTSADSEKLEPVLYEQYKKEQRELLRNSIKTDNKNQKEYQQNQNKGLKEYQKKSTP